MTFLSYFDGLIFRLMSCFVTLKTFFIGSDMAMPTIVKLFSSF